MATEWFMEGPWYKNCNCDPGCPCDFNQFPTHDHCEGMVAMRIDTGRFGDVDLSGLCWAGAVRWPGAIHEGNGEGLILVDEGADEAQREAISTLVGGEVGGPWGILAWTWPTIHGPKAVHYDLKLNGIESRVKAGDALEVAITTIKNPVTGAEVHPGVVLPEGIIIKQGDLGASSVCRVNDGISFDHSGQYAAVGPFEYASA
jgi:hypothetical protein